MTESTASLSRPMTLGVILYPGFELLDVFGPLEMFASVGRSLLIIHMIAERAGPVAAGTVTDGPVGPRVVPLGNASISSGNVNQPAAAITARLMWFGFASA